MCATCFPPVIIHDLYGLGSLQDLGEPNGVTEHNYSSIISSMPFNHGDLRLH